MGAVDLNPTAEGIIPVSPHAREQARRRPVAAESGGGCVVSRPLSSIRVSHCVSHLQSERGPGGWRGSEESLQPICGGGAGRGG